MPWEIPHFISNRRLGMKNYYKAVAGFVAAAIVAFLGAQDGGVTSAEWLQIVLAGLGGSGLVYIAPKNKPKARSGERGAVDLVTVLVVVVLVVLVLVLIGVLR